MSRSLKRGMAPFLLTVIAVTGLMAPSTAHAATWAACGNSDASTKVVRTFDRYRGDAGGGHVLPGGTSRLLCGSTAYGYRHIFAKHRTQWEQDAFLTSKDWRSHTDWAIDLVLRDPDKVSYTSSNDTFVYCRQIVLANSKGQTVGYKYPRVVVAAVTKNIITAYPPSSVC